MSDGTGTLDTQLQLAKEKLWVFSVIFGFIYKPLGEKKNTVILWVSSNFASTNPELSGICDSHLGCTAPIGKSCVQDSGGGK